MAAVTTDTPTTSDVLNVEKTAEDKTQSEETAVEVTTSAIETKMREDTSSKENIEKAEEDTRDTSGEASAEAVESTTTPLDTTQLRTTPCKGDEPTTVINHVTSESATSEAVETNVTSSETELKTSPAEVKPSAASENDAGASTSVCEEDSMAEGSEMKASAVRSKEKTRVIKGILTPAKRKRSPSPDSSPQVSSGHGNKGKTSL